MSEQTRTPFQGALALIVIGLGLTTLGVAAMALLTTRQAQVERDASYSAIPAPVNYPAPELTLNDVDGISHSLSEYRGRAVLVNLWATWCPPCVEELPTLNDFYADNAERGFVIVGIDDGEELGVVREFVARYELDFPIWMDPEALTEGVFGTISLPSSYVIDRKGMVRLQWFGAVSRAMLDKYVIPIIEESD